MMPGGYGNFGGMFGQLGQRFGGYGGYGGYGSPMASPFGMYGTGMFAPRMMQSSFGPHMSSPYSMNDAPPAPTLPNQPVPMSTPYSADNTPPAPTNGAPQGGGPKPMMGDPGMDDRLASLQALQQPQQQPPSGMDPQRQQALAMQSLMLPQMSQPYSGGMFGPPATPHPPTTPQTPSPQGAPLAPANMPPWAQSGPGQQLLTGGANPDWQRIRDGLYNQYLSGGGRPWGG